jgi:hypothetical protein
MAHTVYHGIGAHALEREIARRAPRRTAVVTRAFASRSRSRMVEET